MKNKLNIGCGLNWKEQYPDYKGLDIIDYGQDFVGDILEKFRDPYNGVNRIKWDEVMANHFLEHFSPKNLQLIFHNVHKILKVGGLFKFVVPHLRKERAWVLPHQSFWNETVVKWLGERDADKVYGFGRWTVKEVVINEREDIHAWLIKK